MRLDNLRLRNYLYFDGKINNPLNWNAVFQQEELSWGDCGRTARRWIEEAVKEQAPKIAEVIGYK